VYTRTAGSPLLQLTGVCCALQKAEERDRKQRKRNEIRVDPQLHETQKEHDRERKRLERARKVYCLSDNCIEQCLSGSRN
jgi:hypothetical protein